MRLLSICAIFKNEAQTLREWIEYHKLVGVEHFYLFNNSSQDEYQTLLATTIASGEITLFDWPDRPSANQKHAWVYSTQLAAYEHAIALAKGRTKWLAILDLDEFLVPMQCDHIQPMLERLDTYPGIEIFWRIFGTSGLKKIPKNALMIDLLRKKSLPSHPWNSQCKSIIKPDCFQHFSWPPHRCSYLYGQKPLRLQPEKMVLNHYINRSEHEFFTKKIAQKEHMDNTQLSRVEILLMLQTGNDLDDDERGIRRFLPALQKKLQSC